MLTEANDATFQSEVLQEQGPVLVEFYTPSCGPCQQLEPHLRKLAQRYYGRLKVVKVNSYTAQAVASHYGVQMAPTLIIFQNGYPVQTINGAPPPQRLEQIAQQFA